MRRISRQLRGRARGHAGFTLIELLVVIIIMGIIMSIAIPMFLSQREKAHDVAAATLVRNGLTSLQSAFVDTTDYTKITEAQLEGIDGTIDWVISDHDLVTTSPAWISDTVPAAARDHQIAYYPQEANLADIACVSDSGNSYAIQISTLTLADTGYIKVKVIDGSAQVGW